MKRHDLPASFGPKPPPLPAPLPSGRPLRVGREPGPPIRTGRDRDLYLENLRETYQKKRDLRIRERRRGAIVLIAIIVALAVACWVCGARADGVATAGPTPVPTARPTTGSKTDTATVPEPTPGWEPTDGPAVVELALRHWIRVAPRHPLGVRVYRSEVARAISDGAEVHNLPAELVAAIALRESSGRQDARGRAGELGLLQVHPDTAVRFRCRLGTPGEQVECGCRVLSRHLTKCTRELGPARGLRGALAAYGSRSGSCTPPRGGSVERMVNDRMRLASELRAVMDGGLR